MGIHHSYVQQDMGGALISSSWHCSGSLFARLCRLRDSSDFDDAAGTLLAVVCAERCRDHSCLEYAYAERCCDHSSLEHACAERCCDHSSLEHACAKRYCIHSSLLTLLARVRCCSHVLQRVHVARNAARMPRWDA